MGIPVTVSGLKRISSISNSRRRFLLSRYHLMKLQYSTPSYTIGIDRNLPRSSIRLITEEKLTVKFTHVHSLSIFKFEAKVKPKWRQNKNHTMNTYQIAAALHYTSSPANLTLNPSTVAKIISMSLMKEY